MEKDNNELLEVTKRLIELGNFDRDDLHSISHFTERLIIDRHIR